MVTMHPRSDNTLSHSGIAVISFDAFGEEKIVQPSTTPLKEHYSPRQDIKAGLFSKPCPRDFSSILTPPKTSRLFVAPAQTHVNCFLGLGTIIRMA